MPKKTLHLTFGKRITKRIKSESATKYALLVQGKGHLTAITQNCERSAILTGNRRDNALYPSEYERKALIIRVPMAIAPVIISRIASGLRTGAPVSC